ncbi:DUF354 domain-containing protein [Nitrosopumilus sp. K4]|uniref:DUF354 domain-containing protein n=1 Tax=Nitrosopumilus sp. K4 TaxID=2795383 RepID=UPI001BAD838B|nr:DUF354 domain-containing protein [Nitrosopumilus sp. K4]QUC64480.1 DUF354 domain-containing protein [Nitrosopumilus sp. K4]
MKIWIDILTPKQLLFSEPIISKFEKKHQILCTSRHYNEVANLAKLRNFKLVLVGNHGSNRVKKLEESIERTRKLLPKIIKFAPDLTISFCSPEAARISFGLGIRHIALQDSPHADSVMRLTLPFVQKLLTPKIIPKKEFTKYGISSKNIMQYNAIDAFVTTQRKISVKRKLNFSNEKKGNILIRVDEDQAAYSSKKSLVSEIIKEVLKDFNEYNIIILTRYKEQIQKLKKIFGKKIIILGMSYDGKYLLQNSDVFIGSGGTMTAEAALLGIPTISYNAIPNLIEKYLVKSKLVTRQEDPKKISRMIGEKIKSKNKNKLMAKRIVKKMEDPTKKLYELINQID